MVSMRESRVIGSLLRHSGIAIAFCILSVGLFPNAGAAERFQMALFFNSDSEYGDLEWIELPRPRDGIPPSQNTNGQTGTARDGVLLINYFLEQFHAWTGPDEAVMQTMVDYLQNAQYDWNRIDAVLVDEPFWSVAAPSTVNPCASQQDPRLPDMVRMQRYLVLTAAAVRQVAMPKTRFWVNFSEPEISWMRAENCPFRLNDWYMDVVSMDLYETPFVGQVKSHYDWLFANRPTAYQQLALIPGTFRVYGTKVVTSATAASWVQQYFDYAHQMNASCTLPIGRTGVTKRFDGCPIWLVAGFWGDCNYDPILNKCDFHSDRGGGINWMSLRDPSSSEIKLRWTDQLGIPRKDNLLGRVNTFNIEGRTITGWAIDRTLPESAPFVDTWLDANTPQARFLGTATANMPRQDILDGYGIREAGFSITFPNLPRGCHRLDVYAVARNGTGNAWMGGTSYCKENPHN